MSYPAEEIVWIGGRPFAAHPSVAHELGSLRAKVSMLVHANGLAADRLAKHQAQGETAVTPDHHQGLPRPPIPHPPTSGRYPPLLKEAIVQLIARGELSEEDACALYQATPEELAEWQARYAQAGYKGLKVSSIDKMRRGQRP